MVMKTKSFSRCVTILAFLLSSTFSIFYIWHLDFGFSLHRHTTLVSSYVSNDHDAGDGRRPIVQGSSARRPPSVDYVDLSSKEPSLRRPYNVYPDYNSRAWNQRRYGSQRPCLGPRGVNVNGNPDDMLEAWLLNPAGKRLVSSCLGIETYPWQRFEPRTHVRLLRREWT